MMRLKRNTGPGVLKSFLENIPSDNSCMEWPFEKNKTGYGFVVYEGKSWRVHRLSFTFTNGAIREGFHVCHKCDNPSCFRPDHLFEGTDLDNQRDKVAKGRCHKALPSMRGEKHGNSKLTEIQVLEIVAKRRNGQTLTSLGTEYGVSFTNIWNIMNGKAWKYLAIAASA